MYSWVRWSLATAVVAVAFLLGRMTTAGVLGGGLSFHARAASGTRLVSADRAIAGANSSAPTYALYIDSLIGSQDEADPGQTEVVDSGETDSDGL